MKKGDLVRYIGPDDEAVLRGWAAIHHDLIDKVGVVVKTLNSNIIVMFLNKTVTCYKDEINFI